MLLLSFLRFFIVSSFTLRLWLKKLVHGRSGIRGKTRKKLNSHLDQTRRAKICEMRELEIGAEELVTTLLNPGVASGVCVLDSCGVGRKGSNLLIAGLEPVETTVLPASDAAASLARFEELISDENLAAVFTLSYDLGLDLNGIAGRTEATEPGIYVALFDHLLVHDYDSSQTFAHGGPAVDSKFKALQTPFTRIEKAETSAVPSSNFTQTEYLEVVEAIKEFIRSGETYQTNLTQQLCVPLLDGVTPQSTFLTLRRDHPAPFAAYIERDGSVVVSASPEQFLRVERAGEVRHITAEPIKGTRRRGKDKCEDDKLRSELLASEKDRAENTMIVDLMRNDLGRICEFGSVEVADLCRVEEHPTLFHLVSTVNGTIRKDLNYSDVIRAVFPCGSITGAPKIRTMEIIDRLEKTPRGLSMGAIGCRIPVGFGIPETFEMSVAIRTMVIRDRVATFNVGGGIVIDSIPEHEYDESLLKAKALLSALYADLPPG